MKKYEILYDWPILQITHLADSPVAEAYADQLDEDSLTLFTTLTERMRGLCADMGLAKANRQHFGKWAELRICLERFDLQFGRFPNAVLKKFRVSVMLADKISQAATPLDTTEVDANLFEIRNLKSTLPLPWYSRENSQSFTDSLAAFSCKDIEKLENEISAAIVSPTLLFHLLATLNGLANVSPGHAVLVKKTAPRLKLAAVDAFVKLAILVGGQSIHSVRPHTMLPCVIDPNSIRFGVSYHQWNDVINVLSEYNSRNELLLKYLTIYHVIENFMFKRPIVELESKQAGKVFTIRDFRRLYRQVETTEGEAIKKFFTVVSTMVAVAPTKFNQHWTNRWKIVFPATAATDVNKALAALNIGLKYLDFTVTQSPVFLAQLVYAIRNAVVHNKETEFHLTYASLDAVFMQLIESFLLPSLEEVCFALVGSRNVELWYSQDKLYFYK